MDHGPGPMDPLRSTPARDRAFRMFERFGRKQEGAGIGLSIVHRAIERMDGTLGIADGPGGHGTTFWFRLPAP